jgi:hypothetical protein
MTFAFSFLDQTKLVTRKPQERLRTIGARLDTPDVAAAVKALLLLARAYNGPGYDKKLLDELEYLVPVHATAAADRKQHRDGEKKGTRKATTVAVRNGKLLLRQLVPLLTNAINTRAPKQGETQADRERDDAVLHQQVDSLTGQVRYNVEQLCTRLAIAINLVADPRIAARVVELQADVEPGQVKAAYDAAMAARDAKTSAQGQALTDTADIDALEGLLFLNCKALTTAANAHHMRRGETAKAAQFNLSRFYGPVTATEAPVQPGAPPASPTPGPTG